MVKIPDILQKRQSGKYFRSQPVYDQPKAKVDREAGIIRGVQIIREGEARTHGVHIDSEFVAKTVQFGNAAKHGIKSRFNHPNMSAGALGTMIGTFRNFSVIGTAAYADLHLSEAAKVAPQGNLYEYVLSMAENESQHFGNSIVFADDDNLYVKDAEGEKKKLRFERDEAAMKYSLKVEEGKELVDYDTTVYSEEVYVIPVNLSASDLVDDPAATDSLFSSKVNHEAFAVQVTALLDANPEIWDFVEKHPDKLQPFFTKYEAYRKRKGLSNHKPKMKKKPNFFQRLFSAFKSGGTFDISVTDTDGNQLSIVTESEEPAVGDDVVVLGENGETEPAADGNYVVADGQFEGQTITVADGQIADITDGEEEDEVEKVEDTPPDETSLSALKKQNRLLKKQLTELKKKPAAKHTDLDEEEDFSKGKKKKLSAHNQAGYSAFEQAQKYRDA